MGGHTRAKPFLHVKTQHPNAFSEGVPSPVCFKSQASKVLFVQYKTHIGLMEHHSTWF